LPKLRLISEGGLGDNCDVTVLADSVFEKISTENAPQGVISVIKHLDFFRQIDIIYKEEFSKNACGRSIVLCSVRDPGNLGSAIRSAVAFGVECIILSDDCADIYNPKTVRGAMGSLFRVKVVRVKDLLEYINAMHANGRKVYAAELSENSRSLSEIDLTVWDSIIIGNEGHGIPEDISRASDGGIYIPISSKTESLNASVAAAIFMWEQSKL
jgi:TrmH family RNA methyltransferase